MQTLIRIKPKLTGVILIMKKHLRLTIMVLLAQCLPQAGNALDIPPPTELIAIPAYSKLSVKVIEPHQTTNTQYSFVDYAAIPIDQLLTNWFGGQWQSAVNQIIFFGKDGYRSAISSQKLTKYSAYLAYARSDQQPFTVDNLGQNQKNIELGPYYLIWANQDIPELINHGGYDWPYQVTRIELQDQSQEDKLRPQQQSAVIETGMQETEKYCLNCHSINGVGGQKYPVDLIQVLCGWQESTLKPWIDAPSLIKPGTTMPAFNRMLAAEQREQVITRIVNYLQVMKNQSGLACKDN